MRVQIRVSFKSRRMQENFRNTYMDVFQLSGRRCYPRRSQRGILKAVISREIPGKLLDSRTISISDFSGRAQSFPVRGLQFVCAFARTYVGLTGLEGCLIVIVIQRILDYHAVAGRDAASWLFRAVVNVIWTVICPETFHWISLPVCRRVGEPAVPDYLRNVRAIIFVQLVNAAG